MSLKNRKFDDSLIRCHSCRKRRLDYPFVHQYCQHVVCSRCSYNQKTKMYCLACQTVATELSTPLVALATKNGHCQQISDIIRPLYGNMIDVSRQDVALAATSAYVESTVQSSQMVSFAGVEPVISRIPKGPRSCCSYLFCCCLWEKLYSIFIYVLYFIAFIAILAWSLWALNWLFTGKTDLSNLPWFRDLPYADTSNQGKTSPEFGGRVPGFSGPINTANRDPWTTPPIPGRRKDL